MVKKTAPLQALHRRISPGCEFQPALEKRQTTLLTRRRCVKYELDGRYKKNELTLTDQLLVSFFRLGRCRPERFGYFIAAPSLPKTREPEIKKITHLYGLFFGSDFQFAEKCPYRPRLSVSCKVQQIVEGDTHIGMIEHARNGLPAS